MRKFFAAVALVAGLSSSVALADKGGNGNGHGNKGNGKHQDFQTVRNDIGTGCPPGLAKKQNGCQPPGQARKRWARGEHLPRGYADYTAYQDIPDAYRSKLSGDRYRYIYQDDRVYVVDPTTRLVRDVVQLLR